MTDPFKPARETLQWADKSINDFVSLAIEHFSTSKSYFNVNRAGDGNGWRMLLEYPAELPSSLRREASAALVHTRHAFDQIAFAAQAAVSGRTTKYHSFPWADKPDDLEDRLRKKRFDDRLWELFRNEQPYPTATGYDGGDDLVRALTNLANDKHSVGLMIGVVPASLRLPRFHVVGSSNMILLPRANDAGEVLLAYGDGQIQTFGQCEAKSTIWFKSEKLGMGTNVEHSLRRYHFVASRFLERAQACCSSVC